MFHLKYVVVYDIFYYIFLNLLLFVFLMLLQIENNFPHHGAVAFGHFGKALFEVFKYLGVEEVGYNHPENVLYRTENPFK